MAIVRTLTNGLSKKYKLYTFLSPIVMIGEVIMETAIPYIMSKIIDVGIANHDLHYVIKTGTLMLACAFASLMFGVLAGRFAALASQGFSSNLRKNIFQKIQTFSFSNIDSFSTASLITRLTTDVTNAQNVYQMIIRMCVRSPFMLISGTIMACMINLRLASIFLFSVPILAIAIIIISSVAHPRFQKMLTKYDALNNTVQENLIAIRVVKAFVREDFENEKFQKDAEAVLKTQLHAEKIVVLLSPIMQLTLYCSIIASLWFGGNMIVQGNMKSGELISFLTYITQILMSLMMLGMIFVMIVISRASVKRILEVLQTSSDITTPENCVQDVKDG
ncbi:MAG: ABC transporter ATP-binding protein, partial [Treponema sp.]|nr:ABC transporter ATP-binding protein [Treponema sp.]